MPKDTGPLGHDPVRYGQTAGQRFDAVGLFVQWLAESVAHEVANLEITVFASRGCRPMVRLLAWRSERSEHAPWRRVWAVDHLNMLLESEPRGGLLRQEIGLAVKQMKETPKC